MEVLSDASVSLIWAGLSEADGAANRASWNWSVARSVPKTRLDRKGGDDRNLALYFVFLPRDRAEASRDASVRRRLRDREARVLVSVWGERIRAVRSCPPPISGPAERPLSNARPERESSWSVLILKRISSALSGRKNQSWSDSHYLQTAMIPGLPSARLGEISLEKPRRMYLTRLSTNCDIVLGRYLLIAFSMIQHPLRSVSLSSRMKRPLKIGDTMFRRTFLAATAAASLFATGPVLADGHSKDIVDTAVGAGSFGTLVAAVQAAGLVDTLKSDGPFTVFAPTDDAFAALPEGTVEGLLKPENKDQLTAVLTYHVVPGKVMSGDLSNNMMAKTVQGSDVTIMTDGGVTVDGANVVTADIEASNGVIHVIDAVILPK